MAFLYSVRSMVSYGCFFYPEEKLVYTFGTRIISSSYDTRSILWYYMVFLQGISINAETAHSGRTVVVVVVRLSMPGLKVERDVHNLSQYGAYVPKTQPPCLDISQPIGAISKFFFSMRGLARIAVISIHLKVFLIMQSFIPPMMSVRFYPSWLFFLFFFCNSLSFSSFNM